MFKTTNTIQAAAARSLNNNRRSQDTCSPNAFMQRILLHGKAFMFAAAMVLTFFATQSNAQYTHFIDDDYITARTTQAEFGGSWNNNTAGLVRWSWADGGVKRGEFKATTLARVRSGSNPLCIAARVRWQTFTASPSFSYPLGASVTIGVATTTDGYIRSCRSSTGRIQPIYLTGTNHNTRFLWRVHADICHKATATSMWVCATDSNEYGGN